MTKYLPLLILTLSLPALGQDFRPYPQERITETQWQSYFEQVKSKYGGSARIAHNQPLVIFDDGKSTLYAFTQRGHPAHPAWIARKVVQVSTTIYIDQVGYFAGEEAAFSRLFQAYRELDDKVRDHVKSQSDLKPQ